MKNMFLKISSILIIFLMLIVLTGCANEELKEDNLNNENYNSETKEELKLNPELDGIIGFATEKESDTEKYKIVAYKADGTEINITKADTFSGVRYDYYGGVLYYKDSNNIYEIDLTKGNGQYEPQKILGGNFSSESLYVCSGKIYFCYYEKSNNYKLIECDLETKEMKTIAEGSSLDFVVDTENSKLFYSQKLTRDNPSVLNVYDIKTKETAKIDEGNVFVQNLYGRTYTSTGYISFVSLNEGKLIYRRSIASENGTAETVYSLYDSVTCENKKLDNFDLNGTYANSKIYYVGIADNDNYDTYDDEYNLRVIENNEDKELTELQVNSFEYIFDLGNGKVQAVMTWGQDISTEGHQSYLIDTKTNEITQTDKMYISVNLITESDNVPKIEYKDTVENKITVEEAAEIIKNKWNIVPNNSPDVVASPGEYITQGGPKDYTIRDIDGVEYYVFSYTSPVSDGNGGISHSTHLQTMFISVDGKKYKIRAIGDNFSENDILDDFDESGNI